MMDELRIIRRWNGRPSSSHDDTTRPSSRRSEGRVSRTETPLKSMDQELNESNSGTVPTTGVQVGSQVEEASQGSQMTADSTRNRNEDKLQPARLSSEFVLGTSKWRYPYKCIYLSPLRPYSTSIDGIVVGSSELGPPYPPHIDWSPSAQVTPDVRAPHSGNGLPYDAAQPSIQHHPQSLANTIPSPQRDRRRRRFRRWIARRFRHDEPWICDERVTRHNNNRALIAIRQFTANFSRVT